MMKIYTDCSNGMGTTALGKRGYLNAHLSYKGRSVVIDYEHILHVYFNLDSSIVPFEIYPYNGNDIYLGYAPVDENFQKVDISKLIELIDEAMKDESQSDDANN